MSILRYESRTRHLAGRWRGLASVYAGVSICFALALIALCANGASAAAEQKPAAEQSNQPVDPLGRDTPRGTVMGFLGVAAKQDFALAASYLDLRRIPRSRRDRTGEEIARQLKLVLDRGSRIERMELSNEPSGDLKDGLAPEQEQVGVVQVDDKDVDILLTRVDEPKKASIWLFSSDFVTQVPKLAAAFGRNGLESILPEVLVKVRVFDVALWQWIAMALLVPALLLLSRLIAVGAVYAIALVVPAARQGRRVRRVLDLGVGPFSLILTVAGFAIVTFLLSVSLLARQYMTSVEALLVLAAVTWFLLRMIDVSAEATMGSLLKRGRTAALSIVPLGRRTGKVILIALALLFAFGELGFNVSAGLAAVGVGGVAIALAAQKTLENFFGSVALIADQPVNVGDFCRFGDTLGTIEDIGMRSTRIRTLERTVVSVPNAEFSSIRLENFGKRDRFWFRPAIGLRYETTPDQIRYVLVETRSVLYAHPKVDPDPARVRFVGFGDYSLNIEVFAYVRAADYSEFLEISEDLLLRIMDVVDKSGTGFAFPSQTLYLARDSGLDREKSHNAEQQVEDWRRKQELQLPAFTAERIAALSGAIEYPPPGSPNNRNRT
jgi:MscS family membrane protein